MMIKLGFKWCLKHGVIAVPALAPEAIFLDRRDLWNEKLRLSRLIIEPKSHDITVTLMTISEQFSNTYLIEEKNAFKNTILVAMDFKFSSSLF